MAVAQSAAASAARPSSTSAAIRRRPATSAARQAGAGPGRRSPTTANCAAAPAASRSPASSSQSRSTSGQASSKAASARIRRCSSAYRRVGVRRIRWTCPQCPRSRWWRAARIRTVESTWPKGLWTVRSASAPSRSGSATAPPSSRTSRALNSQPCLHSSCRNSAGVAHSTAVCSGWWEMRSRAVAMASSIVLLAAMPFRSSGLNAPAETSLTFPRIATTAGTPSPISACASPEKGSRCELSAPEQRLRATRRSRWALRSIALSRSAGTRSTPPPSVSRDTTPLPSSSLYAPWAISSTAVGSSPWSASAASRPARVARSTTVVCTATSGRSCRSAAISAEARRGARPAGDAQATRSLIRLGSSPGSGRRWPSGPPGSERTRE
ncbi:hypothetical protein SALBM135S_08146 [Streptomyces alboniger]